MSTNSTPCESGGFQIRPYHPADLEQVMALWLAGNLDAHSFIDPAYWEGSYPQVREQIPQAQVWVAAEGNRLLGFLGLTGDYIAGIFVSREVRSRGVGRALLAEGKRQAPQLSLHVYRRNARALTFYLREGFTVQTTQTDPETGEEELLLLWKKAA